MLCCALLLLCQTIAFARQIPREEIYIGGLSTGCSIRYVLSVYGAPQKKDWREDRRHPRTVVYYVTYEYSPTFRVIGRTTKGQSYEDELDARVYFVITEDDSLSTPSGITVEMPYKTVTEMFGEAKKHTPSSGNAFYQYSYKGLDMYFGVNNEKIITKIYPSPQD